MSQCLCTVSETNRTTAGCPVSDGRPGNIAHRPVLHILPRMSQGYCTWTFFGMHVNICPPKGFGFEFPRNIIMFASKIELQFDAITPAARACVALCEFLTQLIVTLTSSVSSMSYLHMVEGLEE